jgi:curved DNA-binding protein CbpA
MLADQVYTHSIRDADPYEILGVAEDAATGEIRKAFWKTSLLVHPDKCKHSNAAAAFDAVKKAAEALMSSESRHKVDAAKRKAEENKMAVQVMEELERDRQWRIAQGTATEEDMRCEFAKYIDFQNSARPHRIGPVTTANFLLTALVERDVCGEQLELVGSR